MKKLLLMAALLLASCQYTVVNQSRATGKDVQPIYMPGGMLSVLPANGTRPIAIGSVFSVDGHLVTAGHVCLAAERGFVKGLLKEQMLLSVFGNGKVVVSYDTVRIREIDEAEDICLLSGVNPLENLKAGDVVEIGDPVFVNGAPAGFFPVYTDGRVISPSMSAREAPAPILVGKMIISAPAYGGNSGGPVLDSEGKVVGMLVAGHSGYHHITVCVTVPKIEDFLARALRVN